MRLIILNALYRFPMFLLVTIILLTAQLSVAAPLNWNTMTSMSLARSRAASGVVNGKIFVLGGDVAPATPGVTTSVEMYDPLTNSWQYRSALSTSLFAAADAVIGDTVYLLGGAPSFPPAPVATFLAYNTTTGGTTTIGTLNHARFRSSAGVLNNMIYVVGGNYQNSTLSTIEECNPFTGVCMDMAIPLPAPRELAAVVPYNGKLLIIGGIDSTGNATSTVWEYDPTNSVAPFTTKSPLPLAIASKVVAAPSGKLYLVGGMYSFAAPNTWTSDVYEYDPMTGSSQPVGIIPTARYIAATAVVGSTLYVIGGDNGQQLASHNLAVNEAAQLPTGAGGSSGSLLAWGVNNAGQLGDGTFISRAMPGPVMGMDTVKAIAAGMEYSLAVKTDGTLWSWGENMDNGLGDGTSTNRTVPTLITGIPPMVKSVGTGWFHSLAVLEDGSVWRGGNYSNIRSGAMPALAPLDSSVPVQVQGVSNVIAAVGGDYHSLVLTQDGTVWAWGGNNYGQLGNGTYTDSLTPAPVMGLSNVIAIAAGIEFSIALRSDGTVWTWGHNLNGQLGDGSNSDRTLPVQVPGLSGVTAIFGGGWHSMALKANGTVWTWGENNSGQLGDGTTNSRNQPVQVAGLTGIVAIDGECGSSIALKADGTVWDWGGSMVSGTYQVNSTPQQVPGLAGVAAIAGGMDFRLALTGTIPPPPVMYAVTPAAGPNGSISPVAAQMIGSGSVSSFTILPNSGYHIGSVSGCGGSLAGNTYTTGPVSADCTVNATYEADVTGGSCSAVDMVWYSGGAEVRRDFNCASGKQSASGYCYSYESDACSGYRCVAGGTITPACYSEVQCSASCGGTCVQIPAMKQSCSGIPAVYSLSVTISGNGTVQSSVLPGLNCAAGICSQSYAGGTSMLLTANPAAWSDFTGWNGCDVATGNTCTVTVNSARNVTALFAASTTETPKFSPTAFMAAARAAHNATLLPSGKVLVTGGYTTKTAELYDPANNSWSAAGSMTELRCYHTATLLPNGKVLVVGGQYGSELSSVEIYDPATNSWSAGASLASERSLHTATLLPNGTVLVAGGYGLGYVLVGTAEIYDPGSNSWSAAGSLAAPRYGHTATLLPNGRVLVASGTTGGLISSAELYDPASRTWSSAGDLPHARAYHTATLLPNGKVLVAGGSLSSYDTYAELYDPATNSWSSAGSLSTTRMAPTATLLPNGRVLVTGGRYFDQYPTSSEVYDPATNSWSIATTFAGTGRYNHTATLLPNGKVFIAGGYGTLNPVNTTEIFGTTATSYPLTVTLTGDGSGTVHSSPSPDIQCFSGVCSQYYANGAAVTLSATPANGFTFTGWGDSCSGAGLCQVTMNGAKVVKAVFTATGDSIAPVLTTFSMPAAANALTVPVSSLSASDNIAVTGYLLTESSVPPTTVTPGWSGSPPASFTFIAPGNCYVYAWARDAAGNISAQAFAVVDITIAAANDTLAPLITSFTLPASTALTVPVTLAVTDNVGVTGFIVSADQTTPLPGDSRWSSSPPASYAFSMYGSKTLYAWAKDAAGNISAGVMATCLLMDPAETLNTVITGWPANPMPFSPSSFTFIANQSSATFECSLDNQSYFACTSPISFGSLANGSHIFTVRAKDLAGNPDQTPASYSWTVSVPIVQINLSLYTNIANAYAATSSGSVLQVKGTEFREDLLFNRPVDVTLRGGYDGSYLQNTSTTIIHGSVVVSEGSVVVDNIAIM